MRRGSARAFDALRASIVTNVIALQRGMLCHGLYVGHGWDEMRFWVRLGSAIRRGELGSVLSGCDTTGDQTAFWEALLDAIERDRFDAQIAAWSRTRRRWATGRGPRSRPSSLSES